MTRRISKPSIGLLVIHTEPYSPSGRVGLSGPERAMRIAKSCNSQRKKAPPGRYCVRPPNRQVMLVTQTQKVMLAPDLGFEMRSSMCDVTGNPALGIQRCETRFVRNRSAIAPTSVCREANRRWVCQRRAGDWLRGRSEERRVGKEGRSRWSPHH